MSAVIPSPRSPVVDPKTGLPSIEWFNFLSSLIRVSGSKTYNPGSIAAGAMTSTDVTVTGAALGQAASAAFSIALAGLTLSAGVKAAGTVTVTLHNPTGGAIDLGSGTLTAIAWRP